MVNLNFSPEKTLEFAKVAGVPVDPRQPYPEVVEAVAETDYASPDEYYYIFDVNKATDKVYVITSTGEITATNVSPDTPSSATFKDIATPEYYVKYTDLAKAKEATLARKRLDIERELNAYEIYYLVSLSAAACSGSGNQKTLGSGETSFQPDHLVEMVKGLKDYGNGYVFVCSNTIWQDIVLWNWEHDKNIDIFKILDRLNVKIMPIPSQTITVDGSSKDLIGSTKGYLIATNSNSSIGKKPFVMVRKRLNEVDLLGAAIMESGDKPERLVFVSPNPIVSGGTRYLGVGLTGVEEIVGSCTNPYAVYEFTRS